MPSFVTRTVVRLLAERRGLQRVQLDDGTRAYALVDVVGPVAVGDRVVVNTTAVDLDLGSGGCHVVHWNLARDEWSRPGAGHIMKLRYTSLQTDTGAAEDDYRDVLAEVPDLAGLVVVACSLHSQLACAVAVVRHLEPAARVAYVMTDGASLPLVLSDLVAQLQDAGLVDVTISAGQAFGGDLEAVNLHSALALAATVADADVAVVAPGPGVVGTGTALGATAIDLAVVIDAAAALGAVPVVALRYSEADARERHQGVSDGTLVALGLAARSAELGVPVGRFGERVLADLVGRGLAGRHRVEVVEAPDVAALLAAHGLTVTTMGRSVADDPGFFVVAGAAGAVAARVLARSRTGGSVA